MTEWKVFYGALCRTIHADRFLLLGTGMGIEAWALTLPECQWTMCGCSDVLPSRTEWKILETRLKEEQALFDIFPHKPSPTISTAKAQQTGDLAELCCFNLQCCQYTEALWVV